MDMASEKLKKETIIILDSLLSEFGETLPVNFIKRIRDVSDIYFNHKIDGINMWYEFSNIQGFAERNIYSVNEIKIQIMTLRNFIVLSMRK